MNINQQRAEKKLSKKELEYLEELVSSEVFSLKGAVRASKNQELISQLGVLEAISGKIPSLGC